MNSLRLFFAIKLSRKEQAALAFVLKILKQSFRSSEGIRWVKAEHLHVTLQFLNSFQAQQIPLLIEAAQTRLKNLPAFELALGPLEWFPDLKYPKILSLKAGPESILKECSETLGQSISPRFSPIETRPFRGHLTLARFAQVHAVQKPLDAFELPALPSMWVDQLYLIESRPSEGKTSYLTLAQFPL